MDERTTRVPPAPGPQNVGVWKDDSEPAGKSCNYTPARRRHRHRPCSTCMFFVEIASDNEVAPNGRCRRHAPVAGLGYPSVKPDEWCGDHKLDEWRA